MDGLIGKLFNSPAMLNAKPTILRCTDSARLVDFHFLHVLTRTSAIPSPPRLLGRQSQDHLPCPDLSLYRAIAFPSIGTCCAHIVLRREMSVRFSRSLLTSLFSSEFCLFFCLLLVRDRRCAAAQHMPDQEEDKTDY